MEKQDRFTPYLLISEAATERLRASGNGNDYRRCLAIEAYDIAVSAAIRIYGEQFHCDMPGSLYERLETAKVDCAITMEENRKRFLPLLEALEAAQKTLIDSGDGFGPERCAAVRAWNKADWEARVIYRCLANMPKELEDRLEAAKVESGV
ncbi:MAG: hypothetical protein FWC79_06080 [Oscillospiraceae bacterium]|nr:hypothetical protein [Oscillospiraceae bacterium]